MPVQSWTELFSITVFSRPFFIFLFTQEVDFQYLKMSNHNYDQTWAYTVWISKIRLSVPRIWAKNLFPSKPEVDFQRQLFSTSLWSNLNICRLNFENPSISFQDIYKIHFPVQTGSRFSATTFFYHHFNQTWTYAVWISKICLLVLRIWPKSFFPFKPEVDFQRQHFSIITSIKPEHMPFEFRKSVYWFSRYEEKAFSRLNRK